MGYSLNRVSPILGEQQTPAQSTNPRNLTSTPRCNTGHINKNSVPQGADTQQDIRASLYDPDRSVENHLLFVFIVVVQIIGRWSAKTVLETTERKVVYPVQHPVGTPETNNVNLPQHLAKAHKNPILGPEMVTNLGPLVTTHRDLRQADNNSNGHNAPHRANQIIKRVFLTGIIGTVINRDRQDSMKSRIKCILHITLPLPLHSLQAPTCLVILSCSLQKCNLILLRFLQHNKSLN